MNPRNAVVLTRLSVIAGICLVASLAFPERAAPATYAYESPLVFTWEDASGTVDHYNVYLSVNGQPYELFEQVGTNICRIDAEDGKTYVLQVEAEDPYGRVGPMSDPSEPVTVVLGGSPEDTDGDGMPNAWEVAQGLNPFDPADGAEDMDSDGLSNHDEFRLGTSPTDPDTDDDGILDGEESQHGQNPLDPGDNRPVADAGEDQEADPTVVTLDGSASYDPNGDPLEYSWTQLEGPETTLSDDHAMSPAFLGNKAGEYLFELVVNDGTVNSLPDQVRVTIRNVPPAADAGPDQTVSVGTWVVLDAGGSRDPNNDSLTFTWRQTSGPAVTLEGKDTQVPSFAPQEPGIYEFELVAFDGLLYSEPDRVRVTVNSPTKHVPVADAGEDQHVLLQDRVVLDGSASFDQDGDPLAYAWSQLEGPVPVVLEGAQEAQASFQAQEVGTYRFQLVVSDGELASVPDSVRVTVERPANRAPSAVIEPVDPVRPGDWVILDGSASFDPEGDPLVYSWTQIQGAQVTIEGPDQAVTGFYALTEGVLRFELVVHDSEMASNPATVEIRVLAEAPQKAPPPSGHNDKGSSSGCSVGLRGDPDHEVDGTDLLYVLTLFVPPLGAALYHRRRLRRGG